MNFENTQKTFKASLLILVLIMLGSGSASRFDIELKQRQRELTRLKNEIENQKNQAKKLQEEEVGVLENLQNLRRDIENSQEVLQVLEQTKNALNGSINVNSSKANELKVEVQKSQKRLKDKIVYLYKHGEPDYASVLLKAQSQREWLEDYVFLKSILESDRRLIYKLQDQKKSLDSINALLKDRQAKVIENEKQKKSQSKYLTLKVNEESNLLSKVQGSRELVEKAVQEYESHQKILGGLIQNLEKKRKEEMARAKAKNIKRAPVSKELGKICNPVKGKIISEYGYHMHPDLKTKTKNLGIEIQAESKGKVLAARQGVIAQVVDLPGKGLSIIVDHGDSYYSVYGRLSRSSVKVGQKVNSCQEIANIAPNSGTKPRLFFQVSKGVSTINPRDWLRNAQ